MLLLPAQREIFLFVVFGADLVWCLVLGCGLPFSSLCLASPSLSPKPKAQSPKAKGQSPQSSADRWPGSIYIKAQKTKAQKPKPEARSPKPKAQSPKPKAQSPKAEALKVLLTDGPGVYIKSTKRPQKGFQVGFVFLRIWKQIDAKKVDD